MIPMNGYHRFRGRLGIQRGKFRAGDVDVEGLNPVEAVDRLERKFAANGLDFTDMEVEYLGPVIG